MSSLYPFALWYTLTLTTMDRDPSTPPPVPLDVARRPQKVRGRGPCAKTAFFPRIRLTDLAQQEAERLELMVPYAEQAVGEGKKYQFQHLFFFDWFRRFPVSTWHDRIEGMNRRCPWHSELLISTVSDVSLTFPVWPRVNAMLQLIWDQLMARVKWYHRATKRRIGRPKNMPKLEGHWTRLLRNIDVSITRTPNIYSPY